MVVLTCTLGLNVVPVVEEIVVLDTCVVLSGWVTPVQGETG